MKFHTGGVFLFSEESVREWRTDLWSFSLLNRSESCTDGKVRMVKDALCQGRVGVFVMAMGEKLSTGKIFARVTGVFLPVAPLERFAHREVFLFPQE